MDGDSLRVLQLLPSLKAGRHDITEILLKVALNTKKNQKSIDFKTTYFVSASYALIFFKDKIQLVSFSD